MSFFQSLDAAFGSGLTTISMSELKAMPFEDLWSKTHTAGSKVIRQLISQETINNPMPASSANALCSEWGESGLNGRKF